MSFSLLATLGLDAASFEARLQQSEMIARRSGAEIKESLSGGDTFFGSAKGIIQGAAVTYATEKLLEMGKAAVETAHNVREISEDTGLSTDMVQVYSRAFDGTEKLTGAFRSLAQAREKAMGNGADAQKYAQAFERLGVSMESLQNNDMVSLFKQIGDSIHDAAVSGRELADVSEVLGKGGVKSIAGFKRGIDELHQEMKNTGGIMSNADIAALENFNRAFRQAWSETVNELAGKPLAFLSKVVTTFKGKRVYDADHPDPKLAEEEKARKDAVGVEAAAMKKAQADSLHAAAMKTLTEIQAKTAEIQYRELSNDEKRKVLAAQRVELEKEISRTTFSVMAKDDKAVALAKLQEQLEQAKLSLSEIHPDKEKKEHHEHERVDVNAAQRVGAYVYQASQADTQKAGNKSLHDIKQGIDRLNRHEGHF